MPTLDPHSHADLEQGRVKHLDVRLEVDFDRRVLHGEAVLHFEIPGEGPLDLDTRDLDIHAVTDRSGTPLETSLGEPGGYMGTRLTVMRPAGLQALVVRYTTSPDASALQWLEPANTAGGQHPFLFSQCQPIHARSMVPCQDTSRARITYTAEITVPEPLTAVMSAAPGKARPGPRPGTNTFAFSMPQPIPSYLLALAVGDLASRDLGPRSRVYAEPATLEAAAWEFAEVDDMLREAEGLFGTYLWERFDFLVMPPAFPYGGMENPRLTFLTPTLIAGDRSLVRVLAHELAHSWTGNLVTNATMNDFWLNEGFTVWAERRILERLQGREAIALAAAIGRHGLEVDMAEFGEDSPYTRLENDLAGIDPDEVYSLVPYEKGFLFLTLLERTVGREAWDAFLVDYIDQFRFTSITTAEFEAFVEDSFPGLLGRVGAEAWLRGSGVPDNAPVFVSNRLEALWRLADGWKQGERPDPSVASDWSTAEWLVFLQRLPRDLGGDGCAWLDEHFGLNQSGNAEILGEWLVMAATSAYEPAYERIRAFLGSVGRMKFLKPLYAALHRGESTRPMAQELYDAYRDRYHPIARIGLELLLAE
ncbi:MAG: M1 family metallopeptidase [Deltaproteobacteria bacterium]|nr:M1 family metallopeptidase [Deltaproteobacteria bacterium]MBW2258177.1 M1 family metallopeptidase [Deltaproteobacteria bacterium]